MTEVRGQETIPSHRLSCHSEDAVFWRTKNLWSSLARLFRYDEIGYHNEFANLVTRCRCASIRVVGGGADDSTRVARQSVYDRRMRPMSEPTKEDLMARIAELEKKLESKQGGKLEFKVGDKGGVSVYGLGRFPVTLYYEQWIKLLNATEELRAFLEVNKSRLKLRPQP